MKVIADVRWDDEAQVWYAVGRAKVGLATESESLDGLRERVLAVLPDLLELPIEDIDLQLVVYGAAAPLKPVAAE